MNSAARGSSLQPRRSAHTVVLGCAKAERGQMAALLEVFAAQEHHVELVSGVDESRQRWREVGQRYGTRAVYVACGGPGLASAELAALRDELLSLGIPAGSIWAAVVDWSQLDRLIRDVDRMIDAAPVMVPAPPPLSSARTSGPSSAPPPPPTPVHVVGPSVVPGFGEGTIAPMLPPTSARLAPLGPSRDGSQISHVSLVPRPADGSTARSTGTVEPMDRMGSMDAMDSMIARRGSPGRRIALALGTLALAGLVGWMVLAGPGSSSAEAGPTIAEAAVEGSVAGRETPAPSQATTAPARAGAERRSASSDATGSLAAQRSSASTELAEAQPTAALETDDADLVHAALMKRKIRALDILLVSPEATRKLKGRKTPRVLHTGWADAQAYCEGLAIEGVEGWRLPTAGELRTLGSSNMLGRRIYWTATEGDAFGSDRLVWNNQKKRMAPAPGAWKGGRVLCVRLQHPEHTLPS